MGLGQQVANSVPPSSTEVQQSQSPTIDVKLPSERFGPQIREFPLGAESREEYLRHVKVTVPAGTTVDLSYVRQTPDGGKAFGEYRLDPSCAVRYEQNREDRVAWVGAEPAADGSVTYTIGVFRELGCGQIDLKINGQVCQIYPQALAQTAAPETSARQTGGEKTALQASSTAEQASASPAAPTQGARPPQRSQKPAGVECVGDVCRTVPENGPGLLSDFDLPGLDLNLFPLPRSSAASPSAAPNTGKQPGAAQTQSPPAQTGTAQTGTAPIGTAPGAEAAHRRPADAASQTAPQQRTAASEPHSAAAHSSAASVPRQSAPQPEPTAETAVVKPAAAGGAPSAESKNAQASTAAQAAQPAPESKQTAPAAQIVRQPAEVKHWHPQGPAEKTAYSEIIQVNAMAGEKVVLRGPNGKAMELPPARGQAMLWDPALARVDVKTGPDGRSTYMIGVAHAVRGEISIETQDGKQTVEARPYGFEVGDRWDSEAAKFRDSAGREVTLAQLQGPGATLIKLTRQGCPACDAWDSSPTGLNHFRTPAWNAAEFRAADGSTIKGLKIVTVGMDGNTPDSHYDPALNPVTTVTPGGAAPYVSQWVPHFILVDSNGVILGRETGPKSTTPLINANRPWSE